MFKKKNKEYKISGVSREVEQEIREYIDKNGYPLFRKKITLNSGEEGYITNQKTVLLYFYCTFSAVVLMDIAKFLLS